jgi:hypothetical protein
MIAAKVEGRWHLGRLCVRLAVVILFALLLPTATASAIHRIVAIGDLHGDFAAWRDIARAAQLVNANGHWIGRDALLVQTGDVVDRGPNSLEIIRDLMRLQREALRAHGQVIALVGNHEAMNMTGDLRYISADDYAALIDRKSPQRREELYTANKGVIEAAYRQRTPGLTSEEIKQAWMAATPLGAIEHRIVWSPAGEIGRWVISNPAVVLLDGNLFVHGGISPAYSRLEIAQINRQVAVALMTQDTTPQSIINDPLGPLWYRGLAMVDGNAASSGASDMQSANAQVKPLHEEIVRAKPDGHGGAPPDTTSPSALTAPVVEPVEDQLKTLLSAYGAKRIVIGHTPILSGIAILYDGRLIRIDTGISAVFGGTATYLEIKDGIATAHVVQRAPTSLH